MAAVLADGRPKLQAHLAANDFRAATTDQKLQTALDQAGGSSAMYVPLTARDKVIGIFALVNNDPDHRYTSQHLAAATDIGRHAAVIFDNAHLYEQEHTTAGLLQRSLLPKLPVIPGLELAARHLAGDLGASAVATGTTCCRSAMAAPASRSATSWDTISPRQRRWGSSAA